MSLREYLLNRIIQWLSFEPASDGTEPLCDFERIKFELRIGDVLLVEGRSRVSQIIKTVTQSAWSHSALYVGRIHDIENPLLRDKIREHYHGPLNQQLIIESLLGHGTSVHPLEKYKHSHLRICRPKGLSMRDAQAVTAFAIGRLGTEYAVRHILDLLRLLLPWSIVPRRWRSSLFEKPAGLPHKEICSSMLAEAFDSVHFPILPIVQEGDGDNVQFYRRNPRLFTPRDFDYSPFFEIIKYPLFNVAGEHAAYRHLPWQHDTGPINSPDDIPTALPSAPRKSKTESNGNSTQ